MCGFKYDLILNIVKFLNVVAMTIPFGICWDTYYAGNLALRESKTESVIVTLLFLFAYFAFGKIYDAFLISYSRISEMVYSQILALVMSNSILYVIVTLLMLKLPDPLPILCSFLCQIVLSIMWCWLSHITYYAVVKPQDTVIVYDQREGMEKLIKSYGLSKKFNARFSLQVADCLADLTILNKMDVVFLSGIHSHERNIILKYCIARDIQVFMVPRIGDVIMSGAMQMHMLHLPMLMVRRYRPSPLYLLSKRIFDVVSSGIVLLIASPFMLVTAIVIKLTDGGPVFYTQTRLTKDGKEFGVLKFRSTRVDAEKDGVARLSTGDSDPRITPIGRFIRKVRIDELPQLLNIIGGSMSVVGPRPERPEIAAQYCEKMPEFALRLQAKAGLTGYAQVYGKYNTTPYDKLQMDLMYISKPSFIEDLNIIFATIKILFIPESTEGVAEGQETAMK